MGAITCLRDHPELFDEAARWFSERWGIPAEAYCTSMEACRARPDGTEQWYVALDGANAIAAGAGVIDNDFHDRTDLSPNLCALYVEPSRRGCGLARQLLDFARADLGARGCDRLYLITDHVGLYERCGWEIVCMAVDDEGAPVRLYGADTQNPQPIKQGSRPIEREFHAAPTRFQRGFYAT